MLAAYLNALSEVKSAQAGKLKEYELNPGPKGRGEEIRLLKKECDEIETTMARIVSDLRIHVTHTASMIGKRGHDEGSQRFVDKAAALARQARKWVGGTADETRYNASMVRMLLNSTHIELEELLESTDPAIQNTFVLYMGDNPLPALDELLKAPTDATFWPKANDVVKRLEQWSEQLQARLHIKTMAAQQDEE